MLINQKNKTMPNDHIVIVYRREFIEIAFESIEYISTDDYLTTFFYVNGNKFTCTKPLNKIIPKLNADFYQINRSQVVNLNKVTSVADNRELELEGDVKLTVACRRIKELKRRIKNSA
ncbi:LytTR family transcriptional regulator [Puteibacter caeruleilacunae]|nr:LytTR family transcriptional regulator [Puteibacter caeruleilacunae]